MSTDTSQGQELPLDSNFEADAVFDFRSGAEKAVGHVTKIVFAGEELADFHIPVKDAMAPDGEDIKIAAAIKRVYWTFLRTDPVFFSLWMSPSMIEKFMACVGNRNMKNQIEISFCTFPFSKAKEGDGEYFQQFYSDDDGAGPFKGTLTSHPFLSQIVDKGDIQKNKNPARGLVNFALQGDGGSGDSQNLMYAALPGEPEPWPCDVNANS